MYEEECTRNESLKKEIKSLKLEKDNLKYELGYLQISFENKMQSEIEKLVTPLLVENQKMKEDLEKAYQEINRLKIELKEQDTKDYQIDKLTNQVNHDSSNSGVTTSQERPGHKTGPNTYNHREKSTNPTGGQEGHKGTTLTKEELEEKVTENHTKVTKFVHKINGKKTEKDTVKYKVGVICKIYVEKHIFKHDPTSKEKLPKEFYSDVTYKNDLKSLITILGNYYSLGYSKIKGFLYDLTNGMIDISEGSIDNIYEEFSKKTEPTINNITTNLLNGKFQHTDETTTKENGRDTYYRGYGNPTNVLYKYHHHKGDEPIKEDGILTSFFGTVISDHDTGIFKYGTSHQDCVIHIGRYCREEEQNIYVTSWQMKLYYLLLRFERNRKILMKYGRTSFIKEEISFMEKEYDDLLILAEEENKNISSTYWKDKANTLMRRMKKYKSSILFYLYDFDVTYDNNFMERALRMIKGKTKVSGGFRSENGGKRFGNIMSVIKTAKLRMLNPFECVKEIYEGKVLFA